MANCQFGTNVLFIPTPTYYQWDSTDRYARFGNIKLKRKCLHTGKMAKLTISSAITGENSDMTFRFQWMRLSIAVYAMADLKDVHLYGCFVIGIHNTQPVLKISHVSMSRQNLASEHGLWPNWSTSKLQACYSTCFKTKRGLKRLITVSQTGDKNHNIHYIRALVNLMKLVLRKVCY